MDIFRVVFFATVATGIAVLLRNYRPELALLTAVAAGSLVILSMLGDIQQIIDITKSIAAGYGLDTKYIYTALKIVGIACIGELGVQVCKDGGEGAIASKVELAGKIMILTIALPALTDLLSLATGLLK